MAKLLHESNTNMALSVLCYILEYSRVIRTNAIISSLKYRGFMAYQPSRGLSPSRQPISCQSVYGNYMAL